MIYCFDIDGTLCTKTNNNNYPLAVPIPIMIEEVNRLYDSGHYIKLYTARGASSKIDWTELTTKQVNDWGIKHHELILNQKPSYDIFVDDKAYNAEFWKNNFINLKRGIITGCFDIIHPGYIKLFAEAKNICNHLTIALHNDPSIERPNKIKPILSLSERKEILFAIKYVDDIITYDTESDLCELLKNNNFDIRITGSDYINKPITGQEFTKSIVYADRAHGWSTTKYKKLITESINRL